MVKPYSRLTRMTKSAGAQIGKCCRTELEPCKCGCGPHTILPTPSSGALHSMLKRSSIHLHIHHHFDITTTLSKRPPGCKKVKKPCATSPANQLALLTASKRIRVRPSSTDPPGLTLGWRLGQPTELYKTSPAVLPPSSFFL